MIFINFFGLQHAEFLFLDQGSNPCSLQWKIRVLITKVPERSLNNFISQQCIQFLLNGNFWTRCLVNKRGYNLCLSVTSLESGDVTRKCITTILIRLQLQAQVCASYFLTEKWDSTLKATLEWVPKNNKAATFIFISCHGN